MSKVLVSVFDLKAKVFNVPTCFESEDDARRSFFDVCENRETIIGRHPEDFILYLLGRFDVCTGVLDLVDRTPLTDGSEYLMYRTQYKENLTREEVVKDGE